MKKKQDASKAVEPVVKAKDWSPVLDFIQKTLCLPIGKMSFESPLSHYSTYENYVRSYDGETEAQEHTLYGYSIQGSILVKLDVKIPTKKTEEDLSRIHPMFGPMRKRTVTGESETIGQWWDRTQVMYDLIVIVTVREGQRSATLRSMKGIVEELQKETESKNKSFAEWAEKNL
jgi:hypothetical protein